MSFYRAGVHSIGFLAALALPALYSQEEPRGLSNARNNYERDFVRSLQIIQDKYVRALEQHKRTMTREGDISGALEAEKETILSKRWATVPLRPGQRKMTNPKLDQLLTSYEKAVLTEIPPVINRYESELLRLKETLTRSGDLQASVLVDKELKKVRARTSLPTEAAAKLHFSKYSKKEFEEWLYRNRFEFSGEISGRATVLFEDGIAKYDSDSARSTVEYEYRLVSNRSVEIGHDIDKGFIMTLADDLHSGTFRSIKNTYTLRIFPLITIGDSAN
ncbi:MAG: hypothetical protein AAGH89_10595 [Verrucomicrobiota bacterium]